MGSFIKLAKFSLPLNELIIFHIKQNTEIPLGISVDITTRDLGLYQYREL